MLRIIPIKSKIRDYSIEFIESLDNIINLSNKENTLIYIDSKVSDLYPSLSLKNSIKIECIEENKSLNGCIHIFNSLLSNRANIKTKIIAIGGGILQDLVGYCASTFCRGIDYTLVPTTLLSQTDSCIGGKTSLNFNSKKNILGTFYPPSQIIIYEKFLETLSKLDIISGLGEIYKFHILQNKDLVLPITSFKNVIIDSLLYKVNILAKDEFDLHERKILNFGHTIGHALEISSSYNIPHGIAVIIGSMIALRLSQYYGYKLPLYNSHIDTGIKLIKETGIKFDPLWFNYDNLIEIARSDKKNTGKLNMILINNIPIIQSISNLELLEKSIRETYESI